MWQVIEVVAGVIISLWLLSTVCVAVVKLGIREYFKQKRIHYLEMLKHRPGEQENK